MIHFTVDSTEAEPSDSAAQVGITAGTTVGTMVSITAGTTDSTVVSITVLLQVLEQLEDTTAHLPGVMVLPTTLQTL